MTKLNSILIIGCGNMGGAMLTGWLAGGHEPARFTVADPFFKQAPDGVTHLTEIPASGAFDAILLGVKPQMLGDVAVQVNALAGPDTVVLSILAGVELATLARHFPQAGGLVRVMPNLAAALGKSPIAMVGRSIGEGDQTAVNTLMEPLGQCEWLENEGLMDVVTALAGSGPAFVYRFIDALSQGAAKLGLSPEQAERLALATVEGASALAAASEHAPGELARRVASPGGTTQAGLNVLDDQAAMFRLIEATLRSARDRSVEMAAEAREKG